MTTGEVIALIKAFGGAGGGHSGGGVLVVNLTINDNVAVSDKTCKEIWDASKEGIVVIEFLSNILVLIEAVKQDNDSYRFTLGSSQLALVGDNDSSYPYVILS